MSNLNKVTINKSKLLECLDIAENLPDTPKGEIEITENGTYNIAEYANATVNVVGDDLTDIIEEQEALIGELKEIVSKKAGVAVSKAPKDVNFYDYDGTLLHSYTVEQAQELTELPELPTQLGLICQGWNWSLEDIKAHNRAVDVGATYITDDGKTRLYISIAAEGRMTVPLRFQQSIANGVTLDWGDGSATETFSGSNIYISHTYASIGDYVISLEVTSGTLGLGVGSQNYCVMGGSGDSGLVYCNMLRKVEIGSGVEDTLRAFSFMYCMSLESVTIPNGLTNISEYVFSHCFSLRSVVMPNTVSFIGDRVFHNCYSLARIVMPNSVTSIGAYLFYHCLSLASIVIPNRVTDIKNDMFSYCQTITSIAIPDSVTSIGSTSFGYCYSLNNITIPDGVTSIADSTFNYCQTITSIAIPDSVTSIGGYAFYNCKGIAFYDFTACTSVPTLSATSAFQSNSSDCEIRVPAALYDDWIAATNWSTYASQIVAV